MKFLTKAFKTLTLLLLAALGPGAVATLATDALHADGAADPAAAPTANNNTATATGGGDREAVVPPAAETPKPVLGGGAADHPAASAERVLSETVVGGTDAPASGADDATGSSPSANTDDGNGGCDPGRYLDAAVDAAIGKDAVKVFDAAVDAAIGKDAMKVFETVSEKCAQGHAAAEKFALMAHDLKSQLADYRRIAHNCNDMRSQLGSKLADYMERFAALQQDVADCKRENANLQQVVADSKRGNANLQQNFIFWKRMALTMVAAIGLHIFYYRIIKG